jgi:hypothetical protein
VSPGDRMKEDGMAEGKTLEEAFENFAEEKTRGLMSKLADTSFADAMQEIESHWFPVQISIQVQPHNQWIRTYRVTDPDR